ncbi:uncharacterized protein BO80DRAFT_426059 [Aspergillus ibericus CBS 121593]|uniref:Cyanovirin-N domain-containing protein n=1 Tax=Aspergillus ibericus CBS 121593 TaxID=1448316 RepID=A0A395GWS2_9EURO|nr:hypothetical protein BO80DRAFT_426059 [Aspergillus ibericus CBS 121593]RAK99986.1 hypothetical protein BO80DRAFT_426059 [Aspergillus ibericus CBS 121593]
MHLFQSTWSTLLPSILIFSTTVEGVGIRHHKKHSCSGNIFVQCSSIASYTCCGSSRALESTRFLGLGDTYLGAVCTKKKSADCGTVAKSSTGSNLCLSHKNIKGAFWMDCTRCSKRGVVVDEDEEEGGEYADLNVTAVVEPDLIGFGGYTFRINYDVPRNITDTFEALADNETLVEDFPQYLWEYYAGMVDDE